MLHIKENVLPLRQIYPIRFDGQVSLTGWGFFIHFDNGASNFLCRWVQLLS
jgi:hypothetical protein